MSVRQLCEGTCKRPSEALFLFPNERKTGIAPTHLIVEKDINFTEVMLVHMKWERKKVEAEILALNGKFQF